MSASASNPTPYRELVGMALPVSLEAVIQLLLTFVNQVIVGTLGAVAVGAVGLAGSLGFLFIVTVGALGSGTSILVARRHGAGDQVGLSRTVSTTLVLSALLSVVIGALVGLGAAPLLRLAGGDAAVTNAATPYLQVSMLGMLPGIFGWVLSGALRSLGRVKTPLVATVLSVALETVVAYGLVFGLGPLPRLGVVGAAWALVAAQTFKAVWLLYQVYGPRQLAQFEWPRREYWPEIATPLFQLSLPLAFTEFVWSLGGFLYASVFARVGTQALAGSQIVGTLEGIFFTGSFGLMSAATVLIGRSLGQGDGAEAKAWVGRLTRAGLLTALGFGALFGLSVLVLPIVFPKVGAEVQRIAFWGVLLNAAIQWIKVRNMIVGAGVLPSAGDGKGVIVGDVVGAFVVGLPLAIGLGLYTPLGVWGVFVARALDELAKMLIFDARARQVNWDALAREQEGVA